MFISRRTMLIVGVLIVSALTFGIGYAQSDNQIYACEDRTGRLRIVDEGADCRRNETSLQWNIAGEPGPPGPPGLDFYTWSVAVVLPYNASNPEIGHLTTGDVFCDTDDIATGGGWTAQVGASEVTVTRDTPAFGGGLPVGWSVTWNNTSSGVGNGNVYVICADVTE